MNNNAGGRLKSIRTSLGYRNQTDFAEKLGITQTTLSKYENETIDIPDEIKIKLGGFGINLHWLLTGEGTSFLNAGVGAAPAGQKMGVIPPGQLSALADGEGPDTTAVRHLGGKPTPIRMFGTGDLPKGSFEVPLLDQRLSAGPGAALPEEDESRALIRAPAYLAQYGENIAALTVDGDSMEPTLHRGDMVVCDSCGWSGEGIYALRIGGSGFVKRITKAPGKVVIISDNPKYPTREEPEGSEDFSLIGRVHCAITKVE
jgi:DNA-binding XRE family transcriptional regulator